MLQGVHPFGLQPGLEETRFASPTQMYELQKQLDLPAAPVAEPAPAPRAKNTWILPVGVAAVLLIGVAVVFGSRLMRGGASSSGASSVEASAPGAATAASKASEPAVATASLQVESVPAGAAIFLNGRPTNQTTPASVAFTGPAPHNLRLSKRGFVTQEISVTDADLRKGAARYTLAAAEVPKVAVAIRSSYPVDVWSGSQVLSRAKESHQLSVPTGAKLRITAGEYLLNDSVTVTGKPLEYSAPALGRLTVLTKFETCNVKVGDRVLGFPPISRMQVASGQYRVDIVCAGGQNPPGQFVTVAPNETATVRIY